MTDNLKKKRFKEIVDEHWVLFVIIPLLLLIGFLFYYFSINNDTESQNDVPSVNEENTIDTLDNDIILDSLYDVDNEPNLEESDNMIRTDIDSSSTQISKEVSQGKTTHSFNNVKKRKNLNLENNQYITQNGQIAYRDQVISGAFKYYSNAKKRLKELKNRGFDEALILGKLEGMHLVAFGTYSSREKAQKVYDRLIQEGEEEVWIRKVTRR